MQGVGGTDLHSSLKTDLAACRIASSGNWKLLELERCRYSAAGDRNPGGITRVVHRAPARVRCPNQRTSGLSELRDRSCRASIDTLIQGLKNSLRLALDSIFAPPFFVLTRECWPGVPVALQRIGILILPYIEKTTAKIELKARFRGSVEPICCKKTACAGLTPIDRFVLVWLCDFGLEF